MPSRAVKLETDAVEPSGAFAAHLSRYTLGQGTRQSPRRLKTKLEPTDSLLLPATDEQASVDLKASQSPAFVPTKLAEVASPRPSPGKRRRSAKELEEIALLEPVPDRLAPGIQLCFCGINPGRISSLVGFHYGNTARNSFYNCLHFSGLTERLLVPSESVDLPTEYGYGITDLCPRPSPGMDDVATSEFSEGVPVLLQKLATYRPKLLFFVGVGIAAIFFKGLNIGAPQRIAAAKAWKGWSQWPDQTARPALTGLQPFSLQFDDGSLCYVYVAVSTSHRAAGIREPAKTAMFNEARIILAHLKGDQPDDMVEAALANTTPSGWQFQLEVARTRAQPSGLSLRSALNRQACETHELAPSQRAVSNLRKAPMPARQH
ncbi:uncharacterized protein L969DRAFT_44441 [Mixia osmundae IAM 14324]|uniref:Uracil-DNA glycosylase-like domain-containing protein n=1 Tax=Mixia osmundae (strain CBS 9802 / IAM 14324 / JCM 22182 / KY 12970) TaxID=764103 RepID=G7E0C3_MIXOS|nr:uncharacterized protein L969DRAFT_44441 [Mixia osmundae IAM 14324]KEI42275.1 hypothetical protein L969DRAFT_44441 [Mixia osmundae IAM 14324]GAA96283.1 hypothetical protein E5Q_02949 [Mixia osmundae IAM 14324]